MGMGKGPFPYLNARSGTRDCSTNINSKPNMCLNANQSNKTRTQFDWCKNSRVCELRAFDLPMAPNRNLINPIELSNNPIDGSKPGYITITICKPINCDDKKTKQECEGGDESSDNKHDNVKCIFKNEQCKKVPVCKKKKKKKKNSGGKKKKKKKKKKKV